MDILDIFWTFCLNHLSPLWGYFMNLKLSMRTSFLVLICERGLVGIYVIAAESQVPQYCEIRSWLE